MQLIAGAPDATVFLSTAALIIGIFLTVVSAALASNLPGKLEDLIRPVDRSNRDEWYPKAIRRALLVLVITNTFGVLLPFVLLAVNTVMPIESAWVWVVLSWSICVIVINLGAVATIFVGPISARRRLAGGTLVKESEHKKTTLNPASSKVTHEAVPYQSSREKQRDTLVGIAIGIMVGLIAAIRFRRPK